MVGPAITRTLQQHGHANIIKRIRVEFIFTE